MFTACLRLTPLGGFVDLLPLAAYLAPHSFFPVRPVPPPSDSGMIILFPRRPKNKTARFPESLPEQSCRGCYDPAMLHTARQPIHAMPANGGRRLQG
jgi:hypothetical protein